MPEATPEFKHQLRVAFDLIEEGRYSHFNARLRRGMWRFFVE